MMHAAEVIATGFRYPAPDSLDALTELVETATRGVVQRLLRRFIDDVGALSLGEWEELHTATLDLSPLFVPYVGHVAWGENYRRGEFMADLKGAMARAGVELLGELPDHIEPVLRYLAVSAEPQADLVEVLPSAVAAMKETLGAASKTNPYNHLLDATVAYAADLRPLTIGGNR